MVEESAGCLCEVVHFLSTLIQFDDTYKALAAEGRSCRPSRRWGAEEARLGGYQERGVQVQR